ncbi:hypothetical protein [Streptomyces sp. NPDC088725]|uniref:hypothetical protein n=1 Tax=Streptomyces sp. NPDC088725 TaxID=3365873 RepID=UPI00382C06E6
MSTYPDSDFEDYTRDRPENPVLPEDRPRGGGGHRAPGGHHRLAGTAIVVLAIAVLLIAGIALFP